MFSSGTFRVDVRTIGDEWTTLAAGLSYLDAQRHRRWLTGGDSDLQIHVIMDGRLSRNGLDHAAPLAAQPNGR